MKFINRLILFIMLFCFAMAIFLSVTATPGSADLSKVSVEFGSQQEKSGFITWLQTNWSLVALAVSEVAALLPTKASGIVHAVARTAAKIVRVLVSRK